MIPTTITSFICMSTIAIVAAAGALAISSSARQGSGAAGKLVTGLVAGWMVVAFVLAWIGAYNTAPGSVPTIEFGISVPIAIGVLAYLAVPGLRTLVHEVPQHWLIALQVYRAGGAVFLVLWGLGQLPGVFAGPAGLGDVIVGVTAPLVAWVYARSGQRSRSLATAWNIIGLLDLASALTLGFLATPSRFQLLAHDAPAGLVTQFPLVLIPTFIVPLSILLHFASLAKLAQAR
jgi:hypothetical protein